MLRRLVALATQSGVGQPMTASFDTPQPGTTWVLEHLSVEIPNYAAAGITAANDVFAAAAAGQVQAVFTIDGRFIAGSAQGQADSASGDGVFIGPGEQAAVTWNPSSVPGIVQGRATMYVRQVGGQPGAIR